MEEVDRDSNDKVFMGSKVQQLSRVWMAWDSLSTVTDDVAGEEWEVTALELERCLRKAAAVTGVQPNGSERTGCLLKNLTSIQSASAMAVMATTKRKPQLRRG